MPEMSETAIAADAPPPWRATLLTLFPEMFPGPLGHSLAGKALRAGRWALDLVQIRDFGLGKQAQVDDEPFGGGAGLVMRADVLDVALSACDAAPGPLLYLTPRGAPLTQARVEALAAQPGLKLLCGRYEGVDQRLIEASGAEEVSLGDFILSGGEIAALALLDACIRLLPGVTGNPASLTEESFAAGLLEFPLYTRPRLWQQKSVPSVLLSGDHAAIAAWRLAQSEAVTQSRRPDLWAAYTRNKDSAGQSQDSSD